MKSHTKSRRVFALTSQIPIQHVDRVCHWRDCCVSGCSFTQEKCPFYRSIRGNTYLQRINFKIYLLKQANFLWIVLIIKSLMRFSGERKKCQFPPDSNRHRGIPVIENGYHQTSSSNPCLPATFWLRLPPHCGYMQMLLDKNENEQISHLPIRIDSHLWTTCFTSLTRVDRQLAGASLKFVAQFVVHRHPIRSANNRKTNYSEYLPIISICAVWQRQQLPQHIAHTGCRWPGWHYHQRHMLREITSDFGFVLCAERAQTGGQTKARRLHRRHKAAASAKLVGVIHPATVYRTVGVTARTARAATSHSECIERNAESVSGYSVQFSDAEWPQVRCLAVRGLWTLLRASLFIYFLGFSMC